MPYSDYETWKTTPVRADPDLSIVIPTYNEEWRIVPTIGAIASHVSGLGLAWELIIADDGSTDATVSLVEGLGLVNLRALRAAANGGKGSAVRRGVLAARGRYIVFVDAPDEVRLGRVKSRGWSEQQWRGREAAQLPLTRKRENADHVVDNSSDQRSLGRQVDDLMRHWGVAERGEAHVTS